MTSEPYETSVMDRYANEIAAVVMRKFASNLRRRAGSLASPDLGPGLRDAAELAEATAANLESIK